MIIIKVMGGLGNQLFQIFNGINYAIENNQEFIITDKYYFENHFPPDTWRPTYWNNFLNNLQQYVNKDHQIHIDQIYFETQFNYVPLPSYQGNTELQGYFQSEKFFKKNYQQILNISNIPQFRQNILQKYQNIYNLNSCSIHFRLGDYLDKYKGIYKTNNEDYLLSAIKIILYKGTKDFLIFYEPNDIELVKSIMNSLKNKLPNINSITFINPDIPDYEQFLLMSLTKHNITCNSTFSWWAAYINDNPNKIIIAMKDWFGENNNKNTKDLLPESWIIL